MPPGPKPTPTSAEVSSRSKRALLIDRLSQPEGTRIDDLTKELGWLPHTVRAALTGLRRKGYLVAREKREGQASIYRATPPATEKQSTSPSVKRSDRTSSKRGA
jgi:predicted ArsR family transcriptional regulator